MADRTTSGSIVESARRLGTTVLDIAETRLVLFSTDLQETDHRFVWRILWSMVREGPDAVVTVSFMDPVAVHALADNEDVRVVGQEVRAKLERVRDSLIEQSST